MPAEVRILSIITRMGRGGSERRLLDVLDAVPGTHVVVVGRDSESEAIEALARRARVIQLPSLVRAVEPANDLKSVMKLRRLIRQGSFDVVHTHQAKSGLLGRVAARTAGVRLVYHSASGASFGPSYGRVESIGFAVAERVTAPLVNRYFVVGHDLAGELAANGISRRRLEVVRSSLDLSRFVPADSEERITLREELGVDPASKVVCYVGRLDAKKGVGPLPGMIGAAADRGRVTLLIAGDGPLRGDLEAERDRRASEGDALQIVLLGFLPTVADALRSADLVVLPSPKEGLSQVLVQAAACDVPFVSYAVDGVSELLAMGARGRSVPLGDEGAFSAAVADALSGSDGAGADPRAGCRPRRDRTEWAEWDPAIVAEHYRACYTLDLADKISGRRGR